MSTQLPPPSKRQRTDALERSRAQQDIEEIPSDAGSLRIQFFDETTGLPIGNGPVLVPVANADPKNLELLLNTLLGHVSLLFLKNTMETLGLSLFLYLTDNQEPDIVGFDYGHSNLMVFHKYPED